MSSAVPNAQISEVILAPTSDIETSSNHPLTELDSHANMVVLGHNFFVFESTGRNVNDQPFSSDLVMAKKILVLIEL